MNENLITKGYEYAKEQFAAVGVDVDAAIAKADSIPVSMHCWQGDDVIGFDGADTLSGGIATTGNFPGRARTPEELRADMDKAVSYIPGAKKLNLHANYAEKNGKNIDRDEYTIEQFQNWVDWSKSHDMGMDFNPTYFSHPMMDGDFSLTSNDDTKRKFWIEHGIRSREIGLEMAKQLGQPCVLNFWMPDGFKDNVANSIRLRERMAESLDAIFAPDIDENLVPCSIESKVFGIGVESYTVASHEFSYGYAISRNKSYTLDAGHFHPTEVISAKIGTTLQFVDKVLLHVSRPVRWDSDHVITWDDELQRIMDEIVCNGLEDRVFIGLDYFDASINRLGAWAIGMRNARKAILSSALAPAKAIVQAEIEGDYTKRLTLQEERKTLPVGAIWDYYCMSKGVPVGMDWFEDLKKYESEVQFKR